MSEPLPEAMQAIRFAPQPRDHAVCPFCHDDLLPETQVVTCGGCGAPYHSDCLGGELSSCATLGCHVRPELGNRGSWGELNDRAERALRLNQALAIKPASVVTYLPKLRGWLFALGAVVVWFLLRLFWIV